MTLTSHESPFDLINAVRWARDLLAHPEDFRILDTETTGIQRPEIVEIAIIDGTGKTLFNSLVKPPNPIPAEATAIHGITNEIVADAPDFETVWKSIIPLLPAKTPLVVYNYDYDLNAIQVSLGKRVHLYGQCAMKNYASFYGEWNEYRGTYRWQQLTDAAQRADYKSDQPAHRALEDCLMTLAVMRHMAAYDIVPMMVREAVKELTEFDAPPSMRDAIADLFIQAARAIADPEQQIEFIRTYGDTMRQTVRIGQLIESLEMTTRETVYNLITEIMDVGLSKLIFEEDDEDDSPDNDA